MDIEPLQLNITIRSPREARKVQAFIGNWFDLTDACVPPPSIFPAAPVRIDRDAFLRANRAYAWPVATTEGGGAAPAPAATAAPWPPAEPWAQWPPVVPDNSPPPHSPSENLTPLEEAAPIRIDGATIAPGTGNFDLQNLWIEPDHVREDAPPPHTPIWPTAKEVVDFATKQIEALASAEPETPPAAEPETPPAAEPAAGPKTQQPASLDPEQRNMVADMIAAGATVTEIAAALEIPKREAFAILRSEGFRFAAPSKPSPKPRPVPPEEQPLAPPRDTDPTIAAAEPEPEPEPTGDNWTPQQDLALVEAMLSGRAKVSVEALGIKWQVGLARWHHLMPRKGPVYQEKLLRTLRAKVAK